jgi:hypothetical protein
MKTEEKAMEFVPTRTVEKKIGGKWVKEEYAEMSGLEVYRALAEDLIYKHVYKSNYIKSIKRKNNFDGTQTIVITYDSGVRATYIVRN